LSALLGIFSFLLPHTPPKGKAGDAFPAFRALQLFKDPSFAVFFGVSFIITIVLAFYYTFTFPFLNAKLAVADVPSSLSYLFHQMKDGQPVGVDINSLMMVGQVAEMFLLPVLPLFLYRIGMKWVL